MSTVKDNPSRSSSMRLASKRRSSPMVSSSICCRWSARRLHRARLEGRHLRRARRELVERERLERVAGGEQMADVRRIERPAQDAEAHGRLSLGRCGCRRGRARLGAGVGDVGATGTGGFATVGRRRRRRRSRLHRAVRDHHGLHSLAHLAHVLVARDSVFSSVPQVSATSSLYLIARYDCTSLICAFRAASVFG